MTNFVTWVLHGGGLRSALRWGFRQITLRKLGFGDVAAVCLGEQRVARVNNSPLKGLGLSPG